MKLHALERPLLQLVKVFLGGEAGTYVSSGIPANPRRGEEGKEGRFDKPPRQTPQK